jgi:hypothetical protein
MRKGNLIMRNNTLITGLVILLGMGLLAGFYGCNRDAAIQPETTVALVAPDEVQVHQTEATLLTALTDSATRSKVEMISRRDAVERLIHSFEQAGLFLDVPNSFIEEGDVAIEDSLDLHWTRRTVLALRYAQDSMRMASYLVYVESEFAPFILPMSCAFGAIPDTGNFSQVADGVWMMGYEPVLDQGTVHAVMPSAVDANKWWGCFLAGTAGGCIRSAVVCGATGPGYGHCLAVGCAGSAVGSAVGCAILSLW